MPSRPSRSWQHGRRPASGSRWLGNQRQRIQEKKREMTCDTLATVVPHLIRVTYQALRSNPCRTSGSSIYQSTKSESATETSVKVM
jgi:hypothetical protein